MRAPQSERIATNLEGVLSLFERRVPRPDASAGADRREVVVLGLGRYGSGVVEGLRRRGVNVLGVNFDPIALKRWRDAGVGEWPPGYPDAKHTAYDLPAIRHWLEFFCKRFFANQFKRSALPNGPKVSAGGTMSPRGDWRMPSSF